VTLTPRAGDAEEQRFTLRPEDVSKMITIPTGQFNQRKDTPVHHPGGARVVIEQQEKKLKMWPEGSLLAHLVDIRTTDTKVVEDNRQPARCWPPMGTHASYRMEGYRRLLPAPRIAQDRRCNEYGSVGHLARACTTKMTWVAGKKGNRTRREGKTPANRSGRPGGAGVHSCARRELRSHHNLGGCKNRTDKRRKTHRVGSSKDKLTVGSSTICTRPRADYTLSKDPKMSSTEQGETTVAVPQQRHVFYHEFEDPGKMRRSKATLTISRDCDGDEEIGPRVVKRHQRTKYFIHM
jgi:hypothetical protein